MGVKPEHHKDDFFAAPVNNALESGTWTQSIIWDSKTPFRDFTQMEPEEDDEDENRRPENQNGESVQFSQTSTKLTM